jgi:hypothetical protein
MSTSNTVDSPIVSSPIISSPISGSPISNENEPEYADFNPCCAAGMPAGERMFFFKFVSIVFIVFGGGMYGLYKLFEYLGWL